MSALLQLCLVLWALIGAQTQVHHLQGQVSFTDLSGSPRQAEAATGCVHGRPEVWLSPDTTLDTLVHEYAHAYDCIDDGTLNASPTVRPARRPAWVSDYCWNSDVEWYACAVVHYGAVRPQSTSAWIADDGTFLTGSSGPYEDRIADDD